MVSSDFCQLFYPSILSFTLSKLIFTDTSMPCNMVMDLSRLGLFLLGTAPSNTAATYFSALWNGDLNLSVGLFMMCEEGKIKEAWTGQEQLRTFLWV